MAEIKLTDEMRTAVKKRMGVADGVELDPWMEAAVEDVLAIVRRDRLAAEWERVDPEGCAELRRSAEALRQAGHGDRWGTSANSPYVRCECDLLAGIHHHDSTSRCLDAGGECSPEAQGWADDQGATENSPKAGEAS